MTEAASGNLLVVEDDPGIAALQKRRLERAGYTVTTASTAEEAMQRLSEGGTELLTLDYGLPGGITGLELHDRIKEAGYDLPVIIVTGQGDESTVIQALRSGASDFVTKSPEYLDYLPEAIERVLTKVRNEHRLEELEQRFRATFHQAAVGIAQVDLQGRWMMVNERLAEILGYTTDGIYERTLRDVLHPDDPAPGDHVRRLLEGGSQTYSEECRCVRGDGSQVWVNLTGSLVREASGEPVYSILVVEDVTERRRLQEQLEYQSFYEPLTGLPNRSLFSEYLERALQHAGDGGSTSVLAVSFDGLKEVNDGLGHEAGDELIAAVSERLQSCLDPEDSAASLTSGDFVILLENVTEPGQSVRTAERIADQMSIPFLIWGNRVSINVSIGVVPLASAREAPENLIRNASTAMRRARSGETSAAYAVYDEGLDERSLERLRLSNEMAEAFERGEFEVCYEPRVRLATGEIACVEASVRWNHPRRGYLPSGELFNLAEEAGLAFRLTQQLLYEACRQMLRWRDREEPGPQILLQVSISASHLEYPGLDQQVSRALRETGLDPRSLILGIEEEAAMRDAALALITFGELKKLGVKLSLEGFGKGLSSLAYLERFPLDFLKLDRTFTGAPGEHPAYATIVPAITGLSHTLGLQAVAGGLDSRAAASVLRDMGFDLAQGSYLADPSPTGEIDRLLANGLPPVADEPG